jgi:FkbM family methyltransferase
MRLVAAKTGPRSLLNQYYSLLDDEARSRFHARYAKIFRNDGVSLAPGEWLIQFADQKIRLPLRPSWSWLDWDAAVSLLGHDIEVKKTYAALVKSDHRPALFLDVGANYGGHSVLFLSVGIPIIAFEPNQTCLSYFKTVCELNGFTGRWEQVAVGNGTGHIELVYPEKETWLGSVSSDVALNLKKSNFVKTERVPLKTLDDYCGDIPHNKVLIKIDVEGYEPEVIRGASKLLRNCKPKLIFESNDEKSRGELFRLLAESGYSVHRLPWQPCISSRALELDEFSMNTATNFIAISR